MRKKKTKHVVPRTGPRKSPISGASGTNETSQSSESMTSRDRPDSENGRPFHGPCIPSIGAPYMFDIFLTQDTHVLILVRQPFSDSDIKKTENRVGHAQHVPWIPWEYECVAYQPTYCTLPIPQPTPLVNPQAILCLYPFNHNPISINHKPLNSIVPSDFIPNKPGFDGCSSYHNAIITYDVVYDAVPINFQQYLIWKHLSIASSHSSIVTCW